MEKPLFGEQFFTAFSRMEKPVIWWAIFTAFSRMEKPVILLFSSSIYSKLCFFICMFSVLTDAWQTTFSILELLVKTY